MGKRVFANNMDIAHQAGQGMVTAAFPDVCLSPPSPPAGPVPVPYPDTSQSSDLMEGTKTVKIGGKAAGLKDSYYKTSPLGNEAATRSFGASILTHGITGKTCFAAYSMDVKMEGQNVVRHIDLTTSNHSSYPGETPPFPNLSEMHQLALDRIAEQKCPCCGSADCAAAFKDGEEPLSMKEAMGMDPKRSNYSPKRAEERKLLRKMKKTACTCAGATFPSPPCDVYRKPDTEKHTKIEQAWEAQRDNYKKWYKKIYKVELHDANYFLGLMKSVYSAAELAAMDSVMRLSRSERAKNPMAEKYKEMSTDAKKHERINHLTPKKYGGCPTNPENLQPQQTLCSTCQKIDQFMTDNW